MKGLVTLVRTLVTVTDIVFQETAVCCYMYLSALLLGNCTNIRIYVIIQLVFMLISVLSDSPYTTMTTYHLQEILITSYSYIVYYVN